MRGEPHERSALVRHSRMMPMYRRYAPAVRTGSPRGVGFTSLLLLSAACTHRSATIALRPQSGVVMCAGAGVDTRDWVESKSDSIGVAFRHPPNYVPKAWAYKSPGSVLQEWRRDGRSVRSFTLDIVSALDSDSPDEEQSARQSFPGARSYSACIDDTSGRRAVVRVFTSGMGEENGVPFVPHAVSATWPLAGRRQLRFESIGADSVDQRIHLAVVQSVRFLTPPP
jgi:hypothetical protein